MKGIIEFQGTSERTFDNLKIEASIFDVFISEEGGLFGSIGLRVSDISKSKRTLGIFYFFNQPKELIKCSRRYKWGLKSLHLKRKLLTQENIWDYLSLELQKNEIRVVHKKYVRNLFEPILDNLNERIRRSSA